MTDYQYMSMIVEAVKAAGMTLIPLLLAAIGLLVYRQQQKVVSRFTQDRETLERRFAKLDEMSQCLNDIYCFTILVGQYHSITPVNNIENKKRAERLLFGSLPIWNDAFCYAFAEFMAVCFETQQGPNTSAASYADVTRHRQEGIANWDKKWEALFVTPEALSERKQRLQVLSYRQDVVKCAYANVLAQFSNCMGGGLTYAGAIKLLEGNPKSVYGVNGKIRSISKVRSSASVPHSSSKETVGLGQNRKSRSQVSSMKNSETDTTAL